MLNEGVLDTLRKIVKDKQASKVKFKNGKMMNIDMTTANMIVQSYDKRITKPELKKKVEKMIDASPEGDKTVSLQSYNFEMLSSNCL